MDTALRKCDGRVRSRSGKSPDGALGFSGSAAHAHTESRLTSRTGSRDTPAVRRRARPTLYFIAGGLFAVAAIRDAFFPHFFSLGDGNPAISAALAVVFIGLGLMIRNAARRNSNIGGD
jgi:hypothetical protein